MKPVTPLIALGLGLVVNGAYACGIDWNLPKNHFDGVNEFGFVSIWENIGEIDTGDGLVLPLNINFRSDRNTSSSTLGAGWHLALLDSNIVQIDERTFMMFDPAGPFRMFWRDAKNLNILGGQAGWKAEIRGDTITAWADCGGIKLVFNKGRIASMQVKDKTFTYDYQNGQISKLREGNTPILKVERAPVSDEVTGLTLANNQKIEIKLGERPRVQTIQGKNLVVAKDLSLASISTESQEQAQMRGFEYGVDDRIQPTLTVKETGSTDRKVVWNPGNMLISRDGEWSYDIKPGAGPFDNAAIGRKNSNNQSEFWHRDNAKGEEIVQGIDGSKKVTTWFTSGKLAGAIRKKQEIAKGVTRVIYQASYDERGKLFREILEDGSEMRYIYEGDSIQTFRNGTIVSTEIKSKDGKRETKYPDGTSVIQLNRQDGGQFFPLLSELPDSIRSQVIRCDLITKGNFQHIRYFGADYSIIAEKLPEMIFSRDQIISTTQPTTPNYP